MFFSVDLENNHASITLHIPSLNIQTNYDVNGRLLVLPINGQGTANITYGKIKKNCEFVDKNVLIQLMVIIHSISVGNWKIEMVNNLQKLLITNSIMTLTEFIIN